MSHSGILALGLLKEGFHQCGQFLYAAQSAEGQPFHFVLGLHELPGTTTPDPGTVYTGISVSTFSIRL